MTETMTSLSCRLMRLVTLTIYLFLVPTFGWSQTDFVRQLAKDKPNIYIIASGPEAMETARTLQTRIVEHKEARKNKAVKLLTLNDAVAELTTPDFAKSSRFFLFVRKEMPDALPRSLAERLPLDWGEVKGTLSLYKSVCLNAKAGNLAFSMLLTAPDSERLKKTLSAFESHSFGDYKGMTVTQNRLFITNRVAVFSEEPYRDALANWGMVVPRRGNLDTPHGSNAGAGGGGEAEGTSLLLKARSARFSNAASASGGDIWESVDWYPLEAFGKLTPEQLEERRFAFFVNRSRPTAALPPIAQTLLEGRTIQETTTLVAKDVSKEGIPIVLMSAPNEVVLRRKIARYGNFNAIPASPQIEEIKDLRKIGRTALLVSGAGVPDDQKEAIRLLVAKEMRERLRINVEERGDIFKILQKEVTLEELQGATNTAQLLRRKGNLRYVWLYTLLDYHGDTQFRNLERCLTEPPPDFTEGEPGKPSAQKAFFGGRKPKEQYDRELREWQNNLSEWSGRKRLHESRLVNYPMQWERQVIQTSEARVRGILRLVDLQDKEAPVEVVWEKESSGNVSSTPKTFRSDKVTLAGVDNKPSSLDSPPNLPQCPAELLREAATSVGKNTLLLLQEEVWLPDGTAPIPTPNSITRKPAPQEEATSIPDAPIIVSIEGEVVTVTLPSRPTVKVGDRVVAMTTKEIKNPSTGEVIEKRQIALLTLRVKEVFNKTADCIPITAQDRANLEKAAAGMGVKFIVTSVTPTPSKLQPSGAKPKSALPVRGKRKH